MNAAVAKADDPAPSQDAEDADSWLTVRAEDFDGVLKERMHLNDVPDTSHEMDVDRSPPSESEDGISKAHVSKLRDLAHKVDAFVSGKGDLEGAMFEEYVLAPFVLWLTGTYALLSEQSSGEEGGDFSDERFSDSELDSDDNEESASPARQHALENLVSGIDPSEYGRMPASFYDRSQRVAPPKPASDVTGIETVESAKETSIPSTRSRPARAPILTRDSYEGVDSDDDTEGEDELVDEEEEEEKPQLVGDIEVDMAEEEEEFLEFSRQTLGISNDQWLQIVQERRDRGGKSWLLTRCVLFTLPQRSSRRMPWREATL